MTSERTSTWRLHFALYLGLSLLLMQLHAETVNFGEKAAKRAPRHERILQGSGESPWIHRVLVPLLAEGLRPIFAALGAPQPADLEYGYLTWRWIFIFGLFLLFHRYLAHWLEPPWPLLGTVLLAALHGPSFANYWFQPASAADLLIWVAAALLTLRGRDRWLFPLVLVGAFNRETVIFAILIHGALRLGKEPRARLQLRMVALLLCWAIPFVGLRLWLGSQGWAQGSNPLGLFWANLSSPDWLAYAACFFGLLWALPVLHWRRLPADLQRVCLVMLPYLALQLLFGRIREVRLLLPLAMALVPVYLLVLAAAHEEKR